MHHGLYEIPPFISTVPDAPFDVVLTTKEYRSWFDKNANTIKITTKPESTHYQINPVCVRKRNPSFEATKHLQVSADGREKLLPCHKQLLEQSLNILIQWEINKGMSKASAMLCPLWLSLEVKN